MRKSVLSAVIVFISIALSRGLYHIGLFVFPFVHNNTPIDELSYLMVGEMIIINLLRFVFPFMLLTMGILYQSSKRILYAHMIIIIINILSNVFFIFQFTQNLENGNIISLRWETIIISLIWAGIALYALVNLLDYLKIESEQLLIITFVLLIIFMISRVPLVQSVLSSIDSSLFNSRIGNVVSYFLTGVLPWLYAYTAYITVERKEMARYQ